MKSAEAAQVALVIAGMYPDLPDSVCDEIERVVDEVLRAPSIGEVRRLLTAGVADPATYAVFALQAQVSGFALAPTMFESGIADAVLVQSLAPFPASWVRTSRLIGLDGRPPNPLEGCSTIMDVRLLVPRSRLTEEGLVALEGTTAESRKPLVTEETPS